MLTPPADTKRYVIEQYVLAERIRREIRSLGWDEKPELSAEAQGSDGEFESLLERQLLTTEIGYGAWKDLEDDEVLTGVWRVVTRRPR